MASIAQNYLFRWKDLEKIGDLQRLKLVLDYIPDQKLISILSNVRQNGRNDYPIKPMWNSILAGIVFQHNSIESLRRELLRNIQLRSICGFEVFGEPESIVPKPWNYTRFLKILIDHQELLDEMFNDLVTQVSTVLPDFAQTLAHDGKAIETHAAYKTKGYKSPDGRRDTDANIGVKKYKGVTKNGKSWEVLKSWFGYKLHLIIDAKYELPIAFDLTKAGDAETPKAHSMIDILDEKHPELLKQAEYFTSDRGNDDKKLIVKLWRKHKIRPVIDIRNMWKDPDKTKGLSTGENVVYNYKGDVFCVCPKTGDTKQMPYGGFEKDRNGHKYLCSACHNGVECKGKSECPVYSQKYIRISLKEDQRIFTPLARCSYKWKKIYKTRTSVERVNSRVDNVFCFEKHFIKGLPKMKMRLSLAFIVMLAMAYGKVCEKQKGSIASLVNIS